MGKKLFTSVMIGLVFVLAMLVLHRLLFAMGWLSICILSFGSQPVRKITNPKDKEPFTGTSPEFVVVAMLYRPMHLLPVLYRLVKAENFGRAPAVDTLVVITQTRYR